jgi:molecular chaperone DnaK
VAAKTFYVGIDLGTTNSAAALFDGERVEVVRSTQGASITPSVVRIDARGNVTVGARARAMLDRDPENVRAEFKRLMGSPHTIAFPASGQTKRPEDLSAEVLRALRADVAAQVGAEPDCAVVSVPALFELPQTSATSEAARLAGFERIEIIQEPVASALAAGWKADDGQKPWMVYDLGGGTFDASLLETRDGLLRVVGHDGDNFLGGRDFDGAVVDWAIERIAAEHGVPIARADPAHAVALRRLRIAAEEAKIELSRAREAELSVLGLTVGTRSLDVALVLDRATLDRLVEPLVMRSIVVCERLLAAHGIVPGDGALSRVVLVGGPSAMPMLRERVAERLGAPFGDGLDPMTLVAQGAAIYAASAGLEARVSRQGAAATGAPGVKVWLQYPAMSSDVSPYVVGKIVDPGSGARVAAIVVRRTDGSWTSEAMAVDADGTFAAMVNLTPRTSNMFAIEGVAADSRKPVPLSPATFTIVHGVTIGDPPLARSVGVALASDEVQVFCTRGSPLPMRRTFSLRTVEALSPQDPEGCLKVPVVQGEFPLAHLCRVVGTLEISARGLAAHVPADTLVEVTIDLDRGGRLQASARVSTTAQVFDQVAHLVSAGIPAAEIAPRLAELARRVQEVRARAFRHGAPKVIEKLLAADGVLAQGARDEQAARGGDADAAEKVRRVLVDVDATLADAEAELAWPDLDARMNDWIAMAASWLGRYGTPEERSALSGAIAAAGKARNAKNAAEVRRHGLVIQRLGDAAYFRSPGAWEHVFERCASRAAESTDPLRAARLVAEGRAAVARNDKATLERVTNELWQIRPEDAEDRALGHGSGVR